MNFPQIPLEIKGNQVILIGDHYFIAIQLLHFFVLIIDLIQQSPLIM